MKYLIIILLSIYASTAFSADILIENKATYHALIAKTKKELEKGLMFVKEMPTDEGMLFDFRGYENIAMWMKNTYIPLDMIFIDCNLRIVHIHQNAKPMSQEIISSPEKFCYALEINAKEVEEKNILINDKIKIIDNH